MAARYVVEFDVAEPCRTDAARRVQQLLTVARRLGLVGRVIDPPPRPPARPQQQPQAARA